MMKPQQSFTQGNSAKNVGNPMIPMSNPLGNLMPMNNPMLNTPMSNTMNGHINMNQPFNNPMNGQMRNNHSGVPSHMMSPNVRNNQMCGPMSNGVHGHTPMGVPTSHQMFSPMHNHHVNPVAVNSMISPMINQFNQKIIFNDNNSQIKKEQEALIQMQIKSQQATPMINYYGTSGFIQQNINMNILYTPQQKQKKKVKKDPFSVLKTANSKDSLDDESNRINLESVSLFYNFLDIKRERQTYYSHDSPYPE
jgi:hypothetical protein